MGSKKCVYAGPYAVFANPEVERTAPVYGCYACRLPIPGQLPFCGVCGARGTTYMVASPAPRVSAGDAAERIREQMRDVTAMGRPLIPGSDVWIPNVQRPGMPRATDLERADEGAYALDLDRPARESLALAVAFSDEFRTLSEVYGSPAELHWGFLIYWL